MKRSILLFACLAVLGLPGVTEAAVIDPVTITLNMPNQVTTVPNSGTTTLTFAGSISVLAGWQENSLGIDQPWNSSSTNSLAAGLDLGLLAWSGNGTYTGNLFEVVVPAGTAPDLYGFKFTSSNPSVFSVGAFQTNQASGSGPSINGQNPTFTANAPFSVQVNAPVAGVPDQGSTLLLMGASIVALGAGRWLVRPVLPRI